MVFMYFSVSRKTQNPSVSGSGGSQRHAHGTELIHGFNLKTFPQQALHPPPHQLRYTLLILILILITLKHILPLHIWLTMSELLHNYDHYVVVVNSLNSDSDILVGSGFCPQHRAIHFHQYFKTLSA